ncbi:MAG: hypothetical protein U0R44_00690 [Candidatus Micrarchaeia archaeon]
MAQRTIQKEAWPAIPVEVRTLTESAANRLVGNSIDMRDGELRGMTLVVPSLRSKDTYLVAVLPQKIIAELSRRIARFPPSERKRFLTGWVDRNRSAIYESHMANPAARSFSYQVSETDLLPPSTLSDRVPSRTATPVWERRRDIPDEARIRANRYYLPLLNQGRILVGDRFIEEIGGRRYLFLIEPHDDPPPRHPGVSVLSEKK